MSNHNWINQPPLLLVVMRSPMISLDNLLIYPLDSSIKPEDTTKENYTTFEPSHTCTIRTPALLPSERNKRTDASGTDSKPGPVRLDNQYSLWNTFLLPDWRMPVRNAIYMMQVSLHHKRSRRLLVCRTVFRDRILQDLFLFFALRNKYFNYSLNLFSIQFKRAELHIHVRR